MSFNDFAKKEAADKKASQEQDPKSLANAHKNTASVSKSVDPPLDGSA
ncbi:MAG: hypothetical protein AAFO63_02020 [Pseudomonadota bacterium]